MSAFRFFGHGELSPFYGADRTSFCCYLGHWLLRNKQFQFGDLGISQISEWSCLLLVAPSLRPPFGADPLLECLAC